MAQPFERYHTSQDILTAQTQATDKLWATYRWMSMGLAITALVALMVANTPEITHVLFSNRILFFSLMIVQFGMVIAFSAVAARASTLVAASMFFLYSAITGITFSSIFLVYTQSSIAQAFFITAGSFAALSFYGATTHRQLGALGHFLFMGLIGLILASIVNIFLHNPAIYWITTYAGVLIFAGLTAYDTQKLRTLYATHDSNNATLIGALVLYLDFINLFLFILRIVGGRRRD